MINSYQPISAVENDSFRKMVKALNNKAPVIGEDKIRTLISNNGSYIAFHWGYSRKMEIQQQLMLYIMQNVTCRILI